MTPLAQDHSSFLRYRHGEKPTAVAICNRSLGHIFTKLCSRLLDAHFELIIIAIDSPDDSSAVRERFSIQYPNLDVKYIKVSSPAFELDSEVFQGKRVTLCIDLVDTAYLEAMGSPQNHRTSHFGLHRVILNHLAASPPSALVVVSRSDVMDSHAEFFETYIRGMNQGLESLGPNKPRFILVKYYKSVDVGPISCLFDNSLDELSALILRSFEREVNQALPHWQQGVFLWIIWCLSFVLPRSILRRL